MAGITDLPYRLLCRELGCDFGYTEMVSAKAIYYKDKKTYEIMQLSPLEHPSGVQLFGSEPEILAYAAKEVARLGADLIDINMGCPVNKVSGNGEGCALMKNPALVGDIVKAVVGAVNIPVTVKIRKGWDENSVNAVEIAQIAQDNGAAAVGVHGRTRNQMYSGKADWGIISEVKRKLNIPVIASGDIFTAQDAKAVMEQTNCDAVMLARGVRGNPWIFKQCKELLQYGEVRTNPTPQERIEMGLKHLRSLTDFKGEYAAIRDMRSHLAWYIKGMHGATHAREKINKATKYNEIEAILQKLI